MKTIIDKKTGKVLYATLQEIKLLKTEKQIDEVLTENFDDPYYDFETKTFYENAKKINNNVI